MRDPRTGGVESSPRRVEFDPLLSFWQLRDALGFRRVRPQMSGDFYGFLRFRNERCGEFRNGHGREGLQFLIDRRIGGTGKSLTWT